MEFVNNKKRAQVWAQMGTIILKLILGNHLGFEMRGDGVLANTIWAMAAGDVSQVLFLWLKTGISADPKRI